MHQHTPVSQILVVGNIILLRNHGMIKLGIRMTHTAANKQKNNFMKNLNIMIADISLFMIRIIGRLGMSKLAIKRGKQANQ